MKTNICLFFNGNAEKAFNFYEKVFNTVITDIKRFDTMPGSENMPEKYKNKIMHISLTINDSDVMMGTDFLESVHKEKLVIGNNFSIAISPSSEQETNNLFEKLSNGGKITMPLQDTFWNSYFGSCIDKFGVRWMLNYTYIK